MSFEESMARLGEIADQLESGECSLDEAIQLYESALKLTGECQKKLDEAKLKIEKIGETEQKKG